MLIIEIALGIVLAWFIINHFEIILNAILYPFKLICILLIDAWEILYEMIYGLTVNGKKLIYFLLPLVILLTVVIGLIYIIFEYISQPYSKYLFFSLFGSALSFAIFIMLKESYMSYKSKSSKYWIFGTVIGVILSIFLIVLVVRGIALLFS